MKAIILAAGRGSRLKDHTREKPKCLNRVSGQPIIEWIVNSLRKGGVDDIVLITGYKAHMLDYLGVRTIHNGDWASTNMVASLMCAQDEFDEPAVVSYSDIIYRPEAVRLLSGEGRQVKMLYDPNWRELWEARFEDPLSDAESFKLDKNGRVVEIGKPVDRIEHIQGQYMGLMQFSRSGFANMVDFLAGQDYRQMDVTAMFGLMLQNGIKIDAVAYDYPWVEIDTPEDLKLAATLFRYPDRD